MLPLLIAPWRRSEIEVLFRHRGPRGRADPAPDQSTSNHADGAADQADHRTRSGTGRRSAAGPILCRLPAARKAAKKQQQRRMTHSFPRSIRKAD